MQPLIFQKVILSWILENPKKEQKIYLQLKRKRSTKRTKILQITADVVYLKGYIFLNIFLKLLFVNNKLIILKF